MSFTDFTWNSFIIVKFELVCPFPNLSIWGEKKMGTKLAINEKFIIQIISHELKFAFTITFKNKIHVIS